MEIPRWNDVVTGREIAWYASTMIAGEHERQIQKWGHEYVSSPEWLMFLTEEIGELSEAIADNIYRGGSKDHIMQEAIQVATLAIKIAIMAKT